MIQWWQWSMEVEERSLESYRPFIKRGDLVFDIGANQGRKTYIFRKLGAKVVAVDPLFAWRDEFVPEFYWKWGQDPDVQVVAKAVSKEPVVVLHINKFMPWISSGHTAWMTESAHSVKAGQVYYAPKSLIKRTVQTITLDGLINIYGIPAFIKIDVEGAEDEVVQTLTTPVRALNMEFHQDWIPERAMRHMDELGEYRWNYCLNNVGAFIRDQWTDSKNLMHYLGKHLRKRGNESWGDIYGRLD